VDCCFYAIHIRLVFLTQQQRQREDSQVDIKAGVLEVAPDKPAE